MNNFIFKTDKRLINKAYISYIKDFILHVYYLNRDSGLRVSISDISVSFPKLEFNDWYTIDELYKLQKEHTWFEIDYCTPYCAWCKCERSTIADDNEHEECDMRMHYCSEIGVSEQRHTLSKLNPILPNETLDLISSYLI